MAQYNYELIEHKICTNKNNEELMKQIFGRYIDIVNIWESIGFDQETINSRIEQLQKALLNTLVDIKEGEIDLYNQIRERINHYKEQVESLKLRLRVNLSPLISKLAKKTNNSNQTRYVKENEESFDCEHSLVMCNQSKLLEENFFYKSLFLELDKIKQERKRRFLELKSREESLAELLDESELNSSLANKSVFNESDLKRMEEHVNCLTNEKDKRVQLLKKFKETIVKITTENQIDLEHKSSLNQLKHFDEHTIDDYDIDATAMDKYRKSMDKLINKRDELIEGIDTIRKDIQSLWAKFEIQNDAVVDLVERAPDYTQHTFQILLAEYGRCVELKQFKLKDVIVELREQIKSIWTRLVLTSEDCLEFEPFMNETNMSDDLLVKHETYLAEITQFCEKYNAMFVCIQKWIQKWNDHVQFETEYSDPSRFSKRNYSALFEERQRRHFSIELTRLERQLEQEAQEYYSREGKHFKYAGHSILDFILIQKNKYDSSREKTRKERQTKKTSDNKSSTPVLKQNLVKCTNSRTPVRRADNLTKSNKENLPKTPSSLTRVTRLGAAHAAQPNESKKRSLFVKMTSVETSGKSTAVSNKRRSKSCGPSNQKKESKISESDSDYCDLICKESLDTIIGGYSYKNKLIKNGNVSSGIESIVSWSDIEQPVFNSSIIQL